MIQLQAGHSNLLTTMIYNREIEQDLENDHHVYEYKKTKIKRVRTMINILNFYSIAFFRISFAGTPPYIFPFVSL